MSVLLETSLGDIVIDLNTAQCPQACLNFLKLCKIHYYSFNPFFSVKRGFLAQTGDPYGTGEGGQSVWSMLPSGSREYTPSKYFEPERPRGLKHSKRGTVSLALSASDTATKAQVAADDVPLVGGSQFFITLAEDIEYLDGKHAPFGTVVEGQEVDGTLDKIEKAFVDDQDRPLRDIRIRHCVVLDDPFPDPEGLRIPSRTPSPTPSMLATARLDATASSSSPEPSDDEAKEAARRKADTAAAALTLELVGDLPFAEVRPPENILFVCKLNPVTRSEDLELIFSRFGKILSCEVIKDKKTGDSLQYAFIEFDEQESAEQAYLKMQNVLVDDRRIWVDFSQSVSKLHGDWVQKRTGGRGGRGAFSAKGRGGRGGGDHGRDRDRDSRHASQGRVERSRGDEQDSRYSREPPRDSRRDHGGYDRRDDRRDDRHRSSHYDRRDYGRDRDDRDRDDRDRDRRKDDGRNQYRREGEYRLQDRDRRSDRERSPRYR